MLLIKNLSVSVWKKEILNQISCDFELGKNYCILWKNGSGKSSLAMTLMGNPKYEHIPTENSDMSWDDGNEVKCENSTNNEVKKWEKKGKSKSSSKNEKKDGKQRKEPEQLYFNFDD